MKDVKTVNVGIIGLGKRAEVLLASLFELAGVEITAICDIRDEPIERIKGILKKNNRKEPKAYKNYRDLLKQDDVDAIMAPTSWNSHLPIAVDAMQAGKYVSVEVGGASSLDELWQLVHASEQTGVPCMMLENCCYGRNELMVLNMVRKGLFGEIVYCEGGYEHDLRHGIALTTADGKERHIHNRYRNGDLYPTHELGPIAKILRINRGNRFVSLTSTASKSRGHTALAREHFGAGTPRGELIFNKGDVVTTVIKCAMGETITLTHSVSLPRPYSRNGRVQGTRGIWLEDTNGIYIDGLSRAIEEIDPAGNPYTVEHWDPVEKYYDEYDHPIWKQYKDNPIGGHGGIDGVVFLAFLDAVRDQVNTPIDVYDVASWMAVTCLSEQSIALGSMPVAFPDFTNGKWMQREPAPVNKWALDEIYEG